MSEDQNGALTASTSEWNLLTAIQDRLIPCEGNMPAAGALGGPKFIYTYVARIPEDFRAVLQVVEAIEKLSNLQLPGRPAKFTDLDHPAKDVVLREIEREMPQEFGILVKHTYNGYYTNPEVQAILGPGSLPPQPLGHKVESFDEAELTETGQGPTIWREI